MADLAGHVLRGVIYGVMGHAYCQEATTTQTCHRLIIVLVYLVSASVEFIDKPQK